MEKHLKNKVLSLKELEASITLVPQKVITESLSSLIIIQMVKAIAITIIAIITCIKQLEGFGVFLVYECCRMAVAGSAWLISQ